MKRFLLITGVLLVWTSCVTAAEDVTMSAKEYKSMMRRMDAMQRKIDSMQPDSPGRVRGGSARTRAVETKYDKLAQDVSGIYDTLDVVETKALQDRINFGAELRVRVDDFRLEDEFSGNELKNHNHWSSRFRLNMDSHIMRGLTFNSRVTVFKNWADSTPTGLSADYNRSHVADGDADLSLDRAYVDWIPQNFFLPIAFTFGRQPSSEGPPLEYRENRKRQSTYPGLIFDGESDGVVMTIGLERYIKLRNSGLRFFYAKGFQEDSPFSAVLDSATGGFGGDSMFDDTNVGAIFFESQFPGLRNSLMVFSYVRAYDFISVNMDPTTMTFGQADANIGDMEIFGAHFQFSNIANTGLDFFLSGGANESHPNGQFSPNGSGGLLSDFGEASHSGWAYFTGFRYTLPVPAMKNPAIGFEYNKGSQYWFSFTPGGTEVYNKLGTRGEVFETYYIQPFNKYLFMRFGYTVIKYDYDNTGLPFGEPADIDQELQNIYALIDCRF